MENSQNRHEYVLEMEGISKEFPGVKALDNVTLKIRPNSVHALMGENGAGKSTLMKCLFGIYKKDTGEISLEGQKIEFKNSKDALEKGVSMVHQELNQVTQRHTKIAKALKAKTYFCRPYHSWEKGLNENTNGLIRQYFPKQTDFRNISDREIRRV